MPRRFALFALLALLTLAAPGLCAELLSYDFEQGDALAAYAGLKTDRTTASVVPGGADGKGHCLKFTNPTPERYCAMQIKQPISVQKNLVLSFDHREDIEPGKPAAYLGVLFFDDAGKQWWASDKFTSGWRHFEIALAEMHSPNGGVLSLGKALNHVQIYGRAEGDTQAIMTVWLDNIRLETRARTVGLVSPGRRGGLPVWNFSR